MSEWVGLIRDWTATHFGADATTALAAPLERLHLATPGSLVHLWDNVALFVAVGLLEHWGVTALPWPNDEDHTLGWLADAP